jgi:hypothetical protein
MARKSNVFSAIAIFIFTAAVVAVAVPASPQGTSSNPPKTATIIPAFHSAPATTKLGATMDPKQFNDLATQNSYAMAAKIKNVMYQQPCFCYCDANDGHHSLLDCFISDHAASCDICRREGIFTYEQTRKGQTPAQIRKAIIGGEWRKVDLAQYATLKEIR